MRVVNETGSKRTIPWAGWLLVVAIALAILAFGMFKRKGARKPPPIPAETSGLHQSPQVPAC